jgi:hypothetical protein
MWIRLTPLKMAPTAQVGQTSLLLLSSSALSDIDDKTQPIWGPNGWGGAVMSRSEAVVDLVCSGGQGSSPFFKLRAW